MRDMKQLLQLSAARLHQILVVKRKIERLESRLAFLVGGPSPLHVAPVVQKKRTMSAAARRRLSLAAKARWAKFRAAKKK
jgi:hypothetical protein